MGNTTGLFAVCLCWGLLSPASAQQQSAQQALRQPPAQLARPTHRLMIEQADELVLAGEVDEAIALLEKLLDEARDRLVAVPNQQACSTLRTQRFVPLSAWIGQRTSQILSQFPDSATKYREHKREQAEVALQELGATKDVVRLQRVIDRFVATEIGTQFQLLLCDLYLENGWGVAATQVANRIAPQARVHLPAPDDLPSSVASAVASDGARASGTLYAPYAWHLFPQSAGPPSHEADPSGKQLLATAKRLLIAAAMEPEALDLTATRAWVESLLLSLEASQQPDLQRLVQQSLTWSPLLPTDPAVANVADAASPRAVRSFGSWPAWSRPLEKYAASADRRAASRPRVGESERATLPYFPVVRDGRVYVNEMTRIVAYDLETGQPWPAGTSQLALFDSQIAPAAFIPLGYPLIGAPRGTLEIAENCLYAKLGSPITGRLSAEASSQVGSSSYLVGLDLSKQGKLLPGFPLHLSAPNFVNAEFEGGPLVWGELLLVAIAERDNVGLRRSIAAFHRYTGELIWKSSALADGTIPGAERANLISHQRLTMAGGRLYYNTNLGAIACLDPLTGATEWLVQYASPPNNSDYPKPDRYRYRDVTPCLVTAGLVVCAPQDAPEIFALDAFTGELVWSTDDYQVADAIHLLGTHADNLLVSGDRLIWLNKYTGRVEAQFPGATTPLPLGALPSPRGLGRGAIAGDSVYFPTAGEMFVFPASLPKSLANLDSPPIGQRFRIQPSGMDGVNVVFAEDTLLVASPSRLMAFRRPATLEPRR